MTDPSLARRPTRYQNPWPPPCSHSPPLKTPHSIQIPNRNIIPPLALHHMATPPPPLTMNVVVDEITRIHRSLPSRPPVDDVEAAAALVRDLDADHQSRLQALANKKQPLDIPDELFSVLQEMHKSLLRFQCAEQKRDALTLLDLEAAHQVFDELIQRASSCLPSTTNANQTKPAGRSSDRVTRDDSYVKKAKPTMVSASDFSRPLLKTTTKADDTHSDSKLTLIKLASLIEVSSKKGATELDLRNRLSDQIDWLPDSIGKLTRAVALDLSENRIVALPAVVGALSCLTRLDLHSNFIAELPDSIGDLFSLLYLDLRGNQLKALPNSICKLVRLLELDVSSNRLASLPDAMGNLTSLKKLNIETNDVDELPYTIGNCASLLELRADYNRLRCLPEAAGKIEALEVISIRYNNIKCLPTTMGSLANLKEVDVSFNELESIPESLCFATSLVKLNVGNNFADLRSLPRSIGNLEMLEELNISNNQIRFLPDSFGMLSRLRVLNAEENPLEVPPRHIAEMGAQAAVEYMAEYVFKRDAKPSPTKAKHNWAHFFAFSQSTTKGR